MAAAFDPIPTLAEELGLGRAPVAAVAELLASGATVPFIARYRKEATGGLDEVAIRRIEERHGYLVELHERLEAIVGQLDKLGKLDPELERRLRACRTKAELEDLYLP